MRTLLWTALALGAASTAGCFVEANNNPPPACNDGLDNDGDGKIDFPADPGCTSIDDNTETDPAPVTACNDGVDNDGDGRVDYPDDPGCSSVNDDSEGDPQVPVGRLAATWHLQDWNDNTKQATTGACPAGGDTLIVYSLPDGLQDPKLAIKDLFNCADGSGTTYGLDPGKYTVWVEVTSHDGSILYAQSGSVTQTVASSVTSPVVFTFQVDRGYIAASWSLQDVSGTPLTCAQAGAGGVEFSSMVGSNIPISDQFNCTDLMGTTYPLPIADYLFGLAVIDNSKPPKALGPETTPKNESVQYGNQLVNAGSFVLQVGF